MEIVKESEIPAVSTMPQAQSLEIILEDYFSPFRAQAAEWREKAFALKITDESQTEAIEQAADARKAITKIRTGLEKKRVELKEDSLRRGQMIDSIAKTIKAEIEPIEAHLKEQEEFVERRAAERYKALQDEREALLRPWLPAHIDVRTMRLADQVQGAFDMMLRGYKEAHYEAAQAAIRAENERLAKQKIDQEERMRIQAENERLRAEQRERDLQEKERAHALRKEMEIEQQKQKKERAEAERKLAVEREAREKLEREARDRAAKEESDRKAQLAAERKLKRAPDKVKLIALADQLTSLQMPSLKDEEAQVISAHVKGLLDKVVDYIKKNSENL